MYAKVVRNIGIISIIISEEYYTTLVKHLLDISIFKTF